MQAQTSSELSVINDILDQDINNPDHAVDHLCTSDLDFDEDFVKNNLEEILLLLIRDCGAANGKTLTDRVADVFGAVISSGTLYPTLYDLEERGVLESREHIRTKEYHIKDQHATEELLRQWLLQHFVVGTALLNFNS